MLGRSYRPLTMNGLVTLEMHASDRISALIAQLGSLAGDEAQQALRDLIDDPQLAPWKGRLTWSLERQRVVHRDASHRHPTIQQVARALNDQAPANVVDLAALLVERLRDVSEDVRGGNSNPWRAFWNEDGYGRLTTSKPENSCRDSLLAALKERLPAEVDAAPEGRYAADRRADIRVSRGAFQRSHRDQEELPHRPVECAVQPTRRPIHDRPGNRWVRHLPRALVRQRRDEAAARWQPSSHARRTEAADLRTI